MSLLGNIEDHFATVSIDWFIDNRWNYHHGANNDKGTWHHAEAMIVRQMSFDKRILYWTVKYAYNTDTKKFTISCNNESLLKSKYNVVFNKFEIYNPTAADIEFALNHDFIRSLFVDA